MLQVIRLDVTTDIDLDSEPELSLQIFKQTIGASGVVPT